MRLMLDREEQGNY